jgi:hypothetical protein
MKKINLILVVLVSLLFSACHKIPTEPKTFPTPTPMVIIITTPTPNATPISTIIPTITATTIPFLGKGTGTPPPRDGRVHGD